MKNFSRKALLGLLLGFLTITSFQPAYAEHHEEHDQGESTTKIKGVQSEEWSNSSNVPVLESKRFSDYSINQQLAHGNDGNVSDSTQSMFYFLIFLIVLLLLVVLGSAMKLLKQLTGSTGEESKIMGMTPNNFNATSFLVFLFVFFGAIAYEISIHSKYLLPESASETGVSIDNMLWITFAITGFVFIVTHIILFVFAFKYRHDDKRKATYYPDNNKLEMFWTLVPALVLTILILFGFRTWVNATMQDGEDHYNIELYAYQFGWKLRYPGPDGKLGRTDYRLTNLDMTKGDLNPIGLDPNDPASADDIVIDDFVMPKGKDVRLNLRSRDVLHSALLPHFRAQMYCVPGTPTHITLKPLYTTDEFRDKIGKPEFNFELACNQICGASHYNMRKEIKVLDEAVFREWSNNQKPFFASSTSNKQLSSK